MSSQSSLPDDLPELPELPVQASSALAGASAGAGGPPPLRVLDKAPQHLRQAALIVAGASLLQWMPGKLAGEAGNGWLFVLAAKAIMAAAAWLWLQQVKHDFGPKQVGPSVRLTIVT